MPLAVINESNVLLLSFQSDSILYLQKISQSDCADPALWDGFPRLHTSVYRVLRLRKEISSNRNHRPYHTEQQSTALLE